LRSTLTQKRDLVDGREHCRNQSNG
jgi:hypothetical protein